MKELIIRDIIKELEESIQDFGTYDLYDKGASEVMDITCICMALKELHVNEIGDILKEVLAHEHGSPVVQAVINGLQTLPDEAFEKLLRFNNGLLEEFY
jgi:formyltetrahydrofolate synthetase